MCIHIYTKQQGTKEKEERYRYMRRDEL